MPACGNRDCKVSTGICGSITFGCGDLDEHGYWEYPCEVCARAYEKSYPADGPCWPGGILRPDLQDWPDGGYDCRVLRDDLDRD